MPGPLGHLSGRYSGPSHVDTAACRRSGGVLVDGEAASRSLSATAGALCQATRCIRSVMIPPRGLTNSRSPTGMSNTFDVVAQQRDELRMDRNVHGRRDHACRHARRGRAVEVAVSVAPAHYLTAEYEFPLG